MDRIWTPWRLDYITKAATTEENTCVFCRILAERVDEKNFVLFRGRSFFALLNLFPYTCGHIMIVANRHIPSLAEAAAEEMHDIIDFAKVCENALRSEYRPDGLNLGFNLGHAAGAGVAHHLHMHVVPRWVGDANFLSVVGETRVLPEALETTWQRLYSRFSADSAAAALK
jgi:ATP adenylyltransferase